MARSRGLRAVRRAGGLALACCIGAAPSLAAGAPAPVSPTVVYSFQGGADGASPGQLATDAAGNLYGTTATGGDPACTSGCGTAFKVDRSGTKTILVSFDGSNGFEPVGPLTLVGDRLYGTTYSGTGALQYGTVFSVNTDGSGFTILHVFDRTDGQGPEGNLLVATDGRIVGATSNGGPRFGTDRKHGGVLFSLRPDGTYTDLHDFCPSDCPDGFGPSQIVAGPHGIIYGTDRYTNSGKSSAIYAYTPATNVFTTLAQLNALEAGSDAQIGAVVEDGVLIGTSRGGSHKSRYGTLFLLTKNSVKTLWRFSGGADGAYPSIPLVRRGYPIVGTTSGGGAFGFGRGSGGGVLYQFTRGTLTVLYSFNTAGPGPVSPGSLTAGPRGTLAAPSFGGGAENFGTVFTLPPTTPLN